MDTIFFSQNLPQMATETIYIIRATLGNNASYSIKKKRKGSTSTKTLTNQEFMDEIFKPELAYEIPEIIVSLTKAGTNLPMGMNNYLKVVNLIYDKSYTMIRLIAISPTINGASKALEVLITNTGDKGVCSTLSLV